MRNLPVAARISVVCATIVCILVVAVVIVPYPYTEYTALATAFLGFPTAVVAVLSGLVGLVGSLRGDGGRLPSALGCAVGLFLVLLCWLIALGPPD